MDLAAQGRISQLGSWISQLGDLAARWISQLGGVDLAARGAELRDPCPRDLAARGASCGIHALEATLRLEGRGLCYDLRLGLRLGLGFKVRV